MSRSPNRILLFVGVALAVAIASPLCATAAPVSVGYELQITEALPGGSVSASMQATRTLVAADRPMFTLSNTSEGADITGFQITMGNETYAFGSIIFLPDDGSGVEVTNYTPIATPGGHANAPVAGISFANFSEGLSYSFRTDIDRTADLGASLTNYRQALASGPKSEWAHIDVSFSDGTTLSKSLTPADVSGGSSNGTYSYFYCLKNAQPQGQIQVSQQTTPIPEPSTLVLAGLGLVGCVFSARRMRKQRN